MDQLVYFGFSQLPQTQGYDQLAVSLALSGMKGLQASALMVPSVCHTTSNCPSGWISPIMTGFERWWLVFITLKSAPSKLPPLFHTHIIVDWSARSKPSGPKCEENAIWWAVARVDGGSVSVLEPEYARTRHCALQRLVRLIAGELDSGRRLLVGFDFPFGYPERVAAHLTGEACALTLWDWLAERVNDQPDNKNNRFDVAAEINAAYPGCGGPCWGRPTKWCYQTISTKKPACTEQECHPPERRIADKCAKGAKSVWQLYGAGSVGSQVLLGLPALKHLMEAPGIAGRTAVWPFQTGLRTPEARAVIAEVYPSLLREQIGERSCEREIVDCAQVRVNAEAFARLDAGGGLAPLFGGAPWLTPVQRGIIETEEAWILGLGHEDVLTGALL